jgi:hypothetical protein
MRSASSRRAVAPRPGWIAERHRLFIDRWAYAGSRQMHRALADLYEADPRFAKSIGKLGAGLAAFLTAAIRANAAHGDD